MDRKKMKHYGWAAFLFGSALSLGAGNVLAEDAARATAPVREYAATTEEPEELPGMASSLGMEMLSRPVLSMDDFHAIDPGAPVFIPSALGSDTLGGEAKGASLAGNDTDLYGAIKVEPPQHIAFDSRTANEYLTQVQFLMQKQDRKNDSKSDAQVETAAKGEDDASSEPVNPLAEQVKNTLAANAKRGISMASNTPCDLMLMALPYGADAMVFQPSSEPAKRGEPTKGSYIYSIGSLCWNYSCGGKSLLRNDNKKIIARVGHGYQNKQSQFLALLAMSNVLDSYEVRVGGMAYTIANLIESEKGTCRTGANMSLTLVGLSFYLGANEQWKNDRGETWSLDKMVASELNRSVDQGTSEVTDWLLGLESALRKYAEDGIRLTPSLALARKQIQTYHEFILSIQNEQGLWHPKFFLYKGTSDDLYETLYASGHILRFLAESMSDRELADPKIVKAVQSLAVKINQVPATANAVTLTDRQLESLAVALQALSIYQQRLF